MCWTIFNFNSIKHRLTRNHRRVIVVSFSKESKIAAQHSEKPFPHRRRDYHIWHSHTNFASTLSAQHTFVCLNIIWHRRQLRATVSLHTHFCWPSQIEQRAERRRRDQSAVPHLACIDCNCRDCKVRAARRAAIMAEVRWERERYPIQHIHTRPPPRDPSSEHISQVQLPE